MPNGSASRPPPAEPRAPEPRPGWKGWILLALLLFSFWSWQRFATTVDELETGLSAIAAPVEGRDGVFAALGVSGPTARLQDRVDHVGRLLIEQADTLSALLRRRTRSGSDRSKEGVA